MRVILITANIRYLLIRTDLTQWQGPGFERIAQHGRYELWRLQSSR